MVKTDPSLDFEHMKNWDTWTKPPLSFDPFIPLACYMAHRSNWQVALVDAFRAMGLQPHPGDFDALLVALVGVNEHDFLNEALAFFRLASLPLGPSVHFVLVNRWCSSHRSSTCWRHQTMPFHTGLNWRSGRTRMDTI